MNLKPYMTQNEILFFKKYLKKSNTYLEFGSGGSTYFAIKNGINKITSIETDLNWVNKLLKNETISSKIKNKELNLIHHDINCIWWEHISWNKKPKEMKETMKSSWKRYSDLVNDLDYIPDLILNDGRFRVASLLKLYEKINEDTVILFHDYKDRHQYHVVEIFLTKLKNVIHYLFLRKEII